ncbi:MAG: hypothetical protein GY850_45205 [bacterium]|nr:hypothetical protein [bacterium]
MSNTILLLGQRSLLGRRDVSLLTLTEMADCYRRVSGLVDIPLFCVYCAYSPFLIQSPLMSVS